jgi:hypothetical protein
VEVVTYRLDVVFGFLHTQQVRGFDESRSDQGIIQNRSVKINTIAASLYLPELCFSFSTSSTSHKNRANEKWQKSGFLAVRMELTKTFLVEQGRYGLQVHVETISV